jgi:hypothetical protein
MIRDELALQLGLEQPQLEQQLLVLVLALLHLPIDLRLRGNLAQEGRQQWMRQDL